MNIIITDCFTKIKKTHLSGICSRWFMLTCVCGYQQCLVDPILSADMKGWPHTSEKASR